MQTVAPAVPLLHGFPPRFVLNSRSARINTIGYADFSGKKLRKLTEAQASKYGAGASRLVPAGGRLPARGNERGPVWALLVIVPPIPGSRFWTPRGRNFGT